MDVTEEVTEAKKKLIYELAQKGRSWHTWSTPGGGIAFCPTNIAWYNAQQQIDKEGTKEAPVNLIESTRVDVGPALLAALNSMEVTELSDRNSSK